MIIAMVFISILAIGAVSAADDGADIEVISDADDSTDVLSVEEDADQVGIDDVEKETVIGFVFSALLGAYLVITYIRD